MVQHGVMSPAPGTFRLSDGSNVEFAQALELWMPLAYDALIETAPRYNRWTTYLQLTEHVQQVSGVRTRMLIGNWSGKLFRARGQARCRQRRGATDSPMCPQGRDDRTGLHARTEVGRRRPDSRRRRARRRSPIALLPEVRGRPARRWGQADIDPQGFRGPAQDA